MESKMQRYGATSTVRAHTLEKGSWNTALPRYRSAGKSQRALSPASRRPSWPPRRDDTYGSTQRSGDPL